MNEQDKAAFDEQFSRHLGFAQYDWAQVGFKVGCEHRDKQAAQAEPVARPDDDKVICPACTYQFMSIPVNVQGLMLVAGFEPPFTHPAPAVTQPPADVVRELVETLKIALPIVEKQVFGDGPPHGGTPASIIRAALKSAKGGV